MGQKGKTIGGNRQIHFSDKLYGKQTYMYMVIDAGEIIGYYSLPFKNRNELLKIRLCALWSFLKQAS